ncbi:MAG: hypothetical protein G8D91_09215 [gamma proteobacterium symbiont of Clathrolucina costata]
MMSNKNTIFTVYLVNGVTSSTGQDAFYVDLYDYSDNNLRRARKTFKEIARVSNDPKFPKISKTGVGYKNEYTAAIDTIAGVFRDDIVEQADVLTISAALLLNRDLNITYIKVSPTGAATDGDSAWEAA